MADQPDKHQPPAPDARQDRLKLALRENLKRRKSQARERAKATTEATEAPSDGAEACPNGELGKPGR